VTDPANPGQYGGHNNPYNQQSGNPYPPQGGGNPYPPQGGGNPYGPPGGPNPGNNPYAPRGGEAPAPPPYGGMPPATPPKKRRGGLVGAIVGIVVVVLLGIGFVALRPAINSILHPNDTANAKVNDCIHSDALTSTTAKEVKNTKIVKCDDPSANYKVVGIVDNKTEIQFDAENDLCSQYPDAESALWQGVSGKAGSVLCLAPNKK
jgi:hypothetical protein